MGADIAAVFLPNPRIGVSGEDDARGNLRPGDREAVVGWLGAAQAPVGAGDIAGLQEVAVHEARLGLATFGAGGRVEQPVFEIDLRGLGVGRIDAERLPELLDGAPVTEQPSAVLIGAVTLRLPARSGREKARVVRHVKLGRVADAPSIGAVIAKEHGVGVDLLEDLQITVRLDLEDGPAPGAESLDLRAGVGGDEFVGSLPVVQIAAHEGGADFVGGAALLDDDGVELEATVNREDLVAVLDPEQPLPSAAFHEQAAERARTVVRVEARRNDEAQAAAWPQQRVGGFEEELVEVEVRRPLTTKRVHRVAEAGGAPAGSPPFIVKSDVPVASHDREAVLALVIPLGVPKRARGIAHEVRLGAEAGAVVEPVALHRGGGEVISLLLKCLLLAVGAVERVEVREELLGDGFRDVPRRVAEDRVEARARFAEHVRELDLPVEEVHLGRDSIGDGAGLGGRVGEGTGNRRGFDLVRWPEPAGAPEVHGALERAPGGRSEEPFPVDPRPLRRVLHGQGVHLPEHRERVVVDGDRLFEQVLLEQVAPLEEEPEVRREPILDECLDRLGAGLLLEVHPVRVVLVAALPVLPRHHRVVPELVEPRADEGIAALHLVVQEAEREGPIHGLDPERQATELDRKRIEVHGVDAALHHVPAEHRLQARLEALVVRRAGDQLVAEAGFGGGFPGFSVLQWGHDARCSRVEVFSAPKAEQPHEGALAVGLDPAVVLERGVE